jgi:hypothetical protein
MADRLYGLRHHAIVRRHDQHHDVGHGGATGAHRGKRLVARRVDEGDLLATRHFHLIRADVLGDAPRLASRDVGRAQRVEQRGLAVVDVAHDGDNRRARHQVCLGVGGAFQAHLHIGFRDTTRAVAELLHHEIRGVRIQGLSDCRHDAEFHQRLDHLAGARRHAVGELLHGDVVRKDNVAHYLHLI